MGRQQKGHAMEEKKSGKTNNQLEEKKAIFNKRRMASFRFLEKTLQELGTQASVAIELVAALLVFCACIYGIINLIPAFIIFVQADSAGHGLITFLEQVFNVVVGVEFLKMLCKPSSENVLETITFLIARHMVLGAGTAAENLLYVSAIVILIMMRVVIVVVRKKVMVREEAL